MTESINKMVKDQIDYEKELGEKYTNAEYLSEMLAINYGVSGKYHAIERHLKTLSKAGVIHMTENFINYAI